MKRKLKKNRKSPKSSDDEEIDRLTKELCERFRKVSERIMESATDKNRDAWISTLKGFGDELADYEEIVD